MFSSLQSRSPAKRRLPMLHLGEENSTEPPASPSRNSRKLEREKAIPKSSQQNSQSRRHCSDLPTFRWGIRRFFPCSKTPPFGDGAGFAPRSPATKPSSSSDDDAAASGGDGVISVMERPWNMRSKRAMFSAPSLSSPPAETPLENRRIGMMAENPPSTLPSRVLPEAEKSRARRSRGSGTPPRPRFSTSLSRKEIESDFLAITGKKPPRRQQQKRPKEVQMKLDVVYPGFDLTEITPDLYKTN